MTLPVFVVDTNIVVAGLITSPRPSPTVKILNAMLSGTLIYLLSPALLDEYRTVLLRPKLTKLHGLGEQEVDALLVELTANAIWREPGSATTAPDHGDNHLWALLASYPGSILITGEQLLLDHPPEGSSAISPKTYVNRFPRTDSTGKDGYTP